MKLLLVGGAGFIGAEITARLLRYGFTVRVLDRNIQRFQNQREPMHSNGRFEAICGDFADSEVIGYALTGIDVVIHLASSTVPYTSNLDPVVDVNDNVIGSLRMLQACRDRNVKKVVFTSSGGTVYGIAQTIPISEDHHTNPICSYGITKLMTEKYLQLSHHLYGLDYSILRCANTYGPGQNFATGQGAVGIFMRRMLTGKPFDIWGDGSVVRDYVYVGDVAEAHILAASSKERASILNIGSGIGTSLNDLVAAIARVTNAIPCVKHGGARQFDVPNNTLKIDRAREVLGWSPKIDLKTGIELTWKWLRKKGINNLGRDEVESN
jgi:UDP-glucose 4-epimerase